ERRSSTPAAATRRDHVRSTITGPPGAGGVRAQALGSCKNGNCDGRAPPAPQPRFRAEAQAAERTLLGRLFDLGSPQRRLPATSRRVLGASALIITLAGAH